MTWVTTLVGAALVVFVLVDLLATAVSVGHGAGPLTKHLSRGVWGLLLRIHRRIDSDRLLVAGGPIILVLIIAVWVILLILGWSLVFGRAETLLTVQDGAPVAVLGRVRYAASIVIGRGSSVAEPAGALHEVLEPVAAMTGLMVLSLSIAYVLPVVRGVVAKRSLAVYLSTLGRSPHDVLCRAWNGQDLGQLDLHLIALASRVAEIAQSHLAYPVIHYFHSSARETALEPSIVAMDQALMAHDMLSDSIAMDSTATKPLRAAIDEFFDTLRHAFIEPAAVDVDPGDERMAATRESLHECGLPMADEVRSELSEDDVTRNRTLRGYLADAGWADADSLDAPATSTPHD